MSWAVGGPLAERASSQKNWLYIRNFWWDWQWSNRLWDPRKPTSAHRTQTSGCICKSPLCCKSASSLAFFIGWLCRIHCLKWELQWWTEKNGASSCRLQGLRGHFVGVQLFVFDFCNGSSDLRSKVSMAPAKAQPKRSTRCKEVFFLARARRPSLQQWPVLPNVLTYHDFG